MIDGQGQQAAAVGPGPVGGEAQQRDRIAAPGQRQGERPINAGLQSRGQGGPGRAGPVGGVWGQPGLPAAQPIRVRASAARARTAALAPSA
jgi:hypothetical protein